MRGGRGDRPAPNEVSVVWRQDPGLAAPAEEGEAVTFAAPGHVTRLRVGDRAILHDARRQQLFELNDTADLVWQALTSGAGVVGADRDLRRLGLAPAEARAHVCASAAAWMTAGLLAPCAALREIAGVPDHRRRLHLDELSLEIAFHGLPPAACDLVARPFYGAGAPADRLSVVAHGDLFLFFLNGVIRSACPGERLAPQFKALLTELYLGAVDGGFLAHGAMLVRDGRGLLLTGDPGAGKSTLGLAMAAAGWTFGGDDIVRVWPDARASPVTFAACAKSGAWPLLDALWAGFAALPSWIRNDGQQVRYLLPPDLADRSPRTLDAVVVLSRESGAPAGLHPLSPLDGLRALVAGAHSGRWSLTGDALRALVDRLERIPCRRLVYSDAREAIPVLEGLALAPS
ncbi:hypothetical protein [Phenylobacterium sp.]|uniref:hypothetical protein n=1 Tax=Phenylobacterium sp. TaxID=1871053 RepID=UPI0035ADFEFE